MQADEAYTRQRVDDGWASRFEREPLERVVDAWYRQPLFTSLVSDRALYAKARVARCANRPGELARSMRGMSTGRQTPLWNRLDALTRDVLVVYGEQDRKYRILAEHMERLGSRVTTAMIPGAGHNAHLEQPKAVAVRILQHLEIPS
jgi:pimeloyl-ACP methyl ester carboxylesterase